MKLIDWIAILGALAWTPHLVGIVKNWLTKSKVRIITQREVEIGFATYGPIFNLRLAFSVENKDIVISDLKIRVTHESGEERIFEWQGITQHMGKMTLPDASAMPFEKEQSVLAIKLNETFLREPVMTELYNFNKHSFSWKGGNYKISIEMQSPEKFDLVDNIREFNLTPLDIEKMEKNKELLELDYKRKLTGGDEKVDWQWCRPVLVKA